MTGKELKRIRLQLNLTQEEMAKMVGVADGTVISRYERGSRKVSQTLALFARHLTAGCRLAPGRKS